MWRRGRAGKNGLRILSGFSECSEYILRTFSFSAFSDDAGATGRGRMAGREPHAPELHLGSSRIAALGLVMELVTPNIFVHLV